MAPAKMKAAPQEDMAKMPSFEAIDDNSNSLVAQLSSAKLKAASSKPKAMMLKKEAARSSALSNLTS